MAISIEASDGKQPSEHKPRHTISHTTRNIIAGGTLTAIAALGAIAGARGLGGEHHQNSAANTSNATSVPIQETKPQNAPELSFKTPDFEAQTVDGQTFKLSDYKGKPVILYFESPSESGTELNDKNFYDMANATKAYRDKNLTFIVISWNDKNSTLISLVKNGASIVVPEIEYKTKGTQDNNLHTHLRITEAFAKVGLVGYPATFYIKPDSTVSTLVSGSNQQTPGSIDANIQKILQ